MVATWALASRRRGPVCTDHIPQCVKARCLSIAVGWRPNDARCQYPIRFHHQMVSTFHFACTEFETRGFSVQTSSYVQIESSSIFRLAGLRRARLAHPSHQDRKGIILLNHRLFLTRMRTDRLWATGSRQRLAFRRSTSFILWI
jgi:hypothetical protein